MVDIKNIWEDHQSKSKFIIRTRIEDLNDIDCFVATDPLSGLPSFIISFSNEVNIPNLQKYRFRGVEIFCIPFPHHSELIIYLLDNQYLDIYTMFIQNILSSIIGINDEVVIINETFDIITRWKVLFEKLNFQGLTYEQQKGLIGELLLINYLLDNEIPAKKIFDSWLGPNYHDKDFIFEGGIGIEVKVTEAKNPSIKINNEGQLDSSSLKNLFLTLYSIEETNSNGFSLPTLIQQIRSKSYNQISEFNSKLIRLGYNDDDSQFYNKKFQIKSSSFFDVFNSNFPKIIRTNLSIGIHKVSYSIEYSAIYDFLIESKIILKKINHGKSD